MKRRLLLQSAAALLAQPGHLLAQSEKQFRIGVAVSESGNPYYPALLAGLRDLRYVVGRNLIVDTRSSLNDPSMQPARISEVIALKPDVLIGLQPSVVVMRRQTTSIPIVMVLGQDPVAAGLVQSLRRSGTNVTGATAPFVQLLGKHFELLTEIIPKLSRVAFFNEPLPLTPALADMEEAAKAAAAAKGIRLSFVRANDAAGVVKAFAALDKVRPQAIIAPVALNTIRLRDNIIAEARRMRIPAVSAADGELWADSGGVLFYGVDVVAAWRRAAVYADRILKGANPADLPIEQPTRFLFVVNQKAAREIGLKIPQSVLFRADRVIE